MKTTATLKQLALVALLAANLTACKKDDPAPKEPEPDPIEVVPLSIADLKAKSTGESVTIGEENKIFRIKGIVISDKDAGNIDAKTAVVQEATNQPGIVVNFAAAHAFALGEEVEIGVSNQKLVKANGEIVLDAIPLDSAKSLSTGKSITPRSATAAQVAENAEAWNGTLVSLGEGALAGGGGKLIGILDYTDETGAIKLMVKEGAAFHGEDYQAQVRSLTGLVRIKGEEVYVDIRKAEDVAGLYAFVWTENFEAVTTFGQFYSSDPRSFEADMGTWRAYLPFTDYVLASRQFFLDANSDFADNDVLETGKKYLYIPYGGSIGTHSFITEFADRLEGVTSITFTVARSKLDQYIYLKEGEFYGGKYNYSPGYVSSTEIPFQVRVYTDGITVGESETLSDRGVWHTFTIDLSEVNTGTDFQIILADNNSPVPVIFSRISFNYETKPDWAQ